MLCLEKSEFFVKFFIIYPAFGSVYYKHTDIADQDISRQYQCGYDPPVKPFTKVGNEAVNSGAYKHSADLFDPKLICLVKIPKEVHLDITDNVAGEYHLQHMKDARFKTAVYDPVNTIKEQYRKEIKA